MTAAFNEISSLKFKDIKFEERLNQEANLQSPNRFENVSNQDLKATILARKQSNSLESKESLLRKTSSAGKSYLARASGEDVHNNSLYSNLPVLKSESIENTNKIEEQRANIHGEVRFGELLPL